ncbi:low molecular weight phosphotyrosine protein phosphatase [Paenibacillus sp. GSMTC-2017]|uniref:low molecular weight protein-tyrosine-phosphatase n=1 Tax=Paenibacillus sp. GSMTC-2017 TaxID=2794350 RepID=UPI0018D8BE34|nr:low molecular weight protein-tyrosine-phosphatase [Paenibacillus sp. GSMTC-2017]MBH5317751.1 low molecular weight phosphotyrosine protein phosphatase [Paenibacillus sp. GSMTC-2017]
MKSAARILFVCLGNICRSPMAEAVMRHLVKEEGLSDRIEIDSAGTGDWHLGHPPHEGTRKILDEHQISYEGMKSRLVDKADFSSFHYLICMDTKNLKDVNELITNAVPKIGAANGSSAKVLTFMELLPDRGIADVPDPYYEGNFPFVYELVDEGCRALLKQIKADLALE